jgi:hypothetical protein
MTAINFIINTDKLNEHISLATYYNIENLPKEGEYIEYNKVVYKVVGIKHVYKASVDGIDYVDQSINIYLRTW